jgi:L-fuconolactonase
MIIDSHHHFWNYDPEEYAWIGENMKHLRRDFLPSDLKQEIEQAGVEGVVSVQARQTIEETKWLLGLANSNNFIKGVVGWLPLADRDFSVALESFSEEKKLVSLRHVIQDEPDPEFILGKDFNRGISAIKNSGLVYDILIFENQLPNTIKFVDQHPNQIFVLDHIAKPRIRENLLSPWSENLMELARRENVYCKISGMATEADFKHWTNEQLFPYLEVCLESFGAERLMFGSDWPVCMAAVSYSDWLGLVKNYLLKLSHDEQESILSKTVVKVYGLSV